MTRTDPAPLRCLAAALLTAALFGCSSSFSNFGFGGGGNSAQTASVDEALVSEPQQTGSTGEAQTQQAAAAGATQTQQATGAAQPTQTAARSGSRGNYCPKIEIRSGTQSVRIYANPREPSPATIRWQAGIRDTARQCFDGPDGKMTIKIGVSGRVLAGPKGGPGDVTVPVRIAVVKFQEAVLASELYKEKVTVGEGHSTNFRRVYQIDVPDPGGERDYIIYVGFDDGSKKN